MGVRVKSRCAKWQFDRLARAACQQTLTTGLSGKPGVNVKVAPFLPPKLPNGVPEGLYSAGMRDPRFDSHMAPKSSNVQSMQIHNRRIVAVWGALALACFTAGCTRATYRMAADKEVKYLVTQKSNDPRWDYNSFTIGMDPRSRYFDPTSPDCPPMPFDDPAAHRYMHCVAGKNGYPCWHTNGDWYYLENPKWKALLDKYSSVGENGAVKLTQNGSVCLALVHSVDYRGQIEQIYASALDVSTERYRFDVQFFGDSDVAFNHNGSALSPKGEQNTLAVGAVAPDQTLKMMKQFSAGGELIVGFANSVVWQFAGHDTNTTSSLINFSFVQPLLRGGGRAFVLEQLTRVERQLLYNLRTFQRYRQGFYTTITVGNSVVGPVQNVGRQGGLTGGTGLTGFSGQGVNGLGTIGGIQTGGAGGGGGAGGTAGALGLAGGGAGGVGGFVGIVQLVQQVRNAQAVLDIQVRTLGLLEANLEAGLIDIVQVDNFRQNIETQRANLLAAQVNLQTTIDNFKFTILDLPPNLPVEIDDSLLRQFEFLDPRTTDVQHMIDDFTTMVGQLPAEPAPEDIKSGLEMLGKLRQRLADQFVGAHADMQRMEAVVPERKKTMSAERKTRLEEELSKLAEGLADVENRFNQTEAVLANLENSLGTQTPGKITDEIVALSTGLSGLTQELSLIRARARLESVTIPTVELNADRALDIARGNRLDWMNSRGQLVDQWRLIAFNAQQLKAGLNLTFSGNVGTIGNNGVAFNGQKGNMFVGAQFDSPFTRRVDRNNYRLVLIQYQSQRRALYQFEDGVNFNLRLLLRTLEQLQINMEIQRRALVIAIRRVDKTREDLNKPPEPVQPGQQVELLGPTVASNLISALTDLQGAQNNFMSVVLNHYENRMLLYRELGIMEMDDCGMWVDKPINAADWLSDDQSPMPPGVPADWVEDAGVTPQDINDFEAKHSHDSVEMPFQDLTLLPNDAKRSPAVSQKPVAGSRIRKQGAAEVSTPKTAPRRPADGESDDEMTPVLPEPGGRSAPRENRSPNQLTSALLPAEQKPSEDEKPAPNRLILRR